jgi:N-acetylglutamate synthase-like GNAT family acetyltransferase
MNLFITKRNLSAKEIDLFQREIANSPDITLFPKRRWENFDTLFVATDNKKLVGVCAVINLGNWKKLGPLIILKNYYGKKCGTKLLSHTVNSVKHCNLFIGSSNPRVWSIISKLGFSQSKYLQLPNEVRQYFLKYIIENLSCIFILDAVRKKLRHKRGVYKTFVRCP